MALPYRFYLLVKRVWFQAFEQVWHYLSVTITPKHALELVITSSVKDR
jgi:hypothetical protein